MILSFGYVKSLPGFLNRYWAVGRPSVEKACLEDGKHSDGELLDPVLVPLVDFWDLLRTSFKVKALASDCKGQQRRCVHFKLLPGLDAKFHGGQGRRMSVC